MSYGNSLTRAAYYHSPVWVQNIFCTAYGYKHRRLWQGGYFRQCYRSLQENQWKSTDEVLHLQWNRLKELLLHAYEHVTYYQQQWKQLGITPHDIKSTEDLRYLPLLEKETVKERAADFVSGAFKKGKLLTSHTSGTTGKQINILVSREAYEREYSFRWHHYSWSGVGFGARRAYLSGHPVVQPDCQSPPFSRINHAERALLCSSQHLSEKNLPHYFREMESFLPEFIEGYPSSVYLLAEYARSHEIRLLRPRGVYVTSETLFDFQRAAIEDAFACKVFNWYGNTERAGNITECPEGSLHIQLEHAVMEILGENGEPAAEGTDGEIAVTGLANFAFPLIRYRVGDVAIPKRGRCSCRRSGPLVERIIGRVEDYVVAADGRHFGRLDHIFKDTEGVKEAQIIQDRIDHLVLRIVARPGFCHTDAAQVLHAARERVGSTFDLDVQVVDKIERGPNAKFRFIVNQLKQQEASVASMERAGVGSPQNE